MILGIECTAHTFGVAVVSKGKVLSNVRDMYKPAKGGIIPMESAKHHRAVADGIYKKALDEAGVLEKDIDAIALSNAPGLAPCLIEGLKFAKEKAPELKVPIIPVNHCIAHLEIGQSVGAEDPVLLYASGANTQIIAFSSGKYRVFGETLDSGIGNFIDTFARHCGIPFPGGPEIEKLANKYVAQPPTAPPTRPKSRNKPARKLGDNNRDLIELPYSIKGMDVSFSGMQTKLKQLYDKVQVSHSPNPKVSQNKQSKLRNKSAQRLGDNSENYNLSDLAYSLQEHAFAMLVEASERALAHTGKKELVLGGGVACNGRLQEMCKIMCKERGAKYFCPPKDLLLDNAAMIAYTGELMLKKGKKNSVVGVNKLDISPRERTDDIEVFWR